MKRALATALFALLLCLCAGALAEENWLTGVLEKNRAEPSESGSLKRPRAEEYVALLYIDGEISAYDYYYDHFGTLDALDALCYDAANVGLMIVLNTPGGGMYEADELLHALDVYKQTGRPVYAYMEQECCSAGVYVAMGAQWIMASRMSLTGSVGVYLESVSEAGLMEKLGIEEAFVASGENKVTGYPTLTDAQREIYQSIVDETFDFFKDAITASRGLTPEEMEPFLDGRLLTAIQAKEMGLIDDVMYYDEAVEYVLTQFGKDVTLRDVTPVWEEESYGYDEPSAMDLVDWLLPEAGGGSGAVRERRTGGVKGGR